MSEPGPARFLLACGLVSALLHVIGFAAAPVQDRVVKPVQPRRPGSVLVVPPRAAVEAPLGQTTGKGEPVSAVAESHLPIDPLPVAVAEPPPVAATDTPGDGDYVPRPLLSVPPRPQSPVMLAWPDFEGAQTLYRGVLALYIDEDGVVQRVRAVEGDLTPELEAQACAVFLGTRFSPGQLDGSAVRSRLQVEVVFEKPEPPPLAVRSLRH